MFLGYQEEIIEGSAVPTLFISHIAETREELENMPCVAFVKIEETDKTYFLHNGSYVCEVPFDQQVEEVRQARANAYADKVDKLMAEYTRKKTFNIFEEGEEEKLLAEINAKVEEIKTRFPYPDKEINSFEREEVIEDGMQREEKEIEENKEKDIEIVEEKSTIL